MSSIKMMFTLFVLCLVCACSLFEPFVDRRRNAGASDISKLYVGRSTHDEPAVCANYLWTSKEKVQALADDQCRKHGTGTHAVQTKQTHFTCPLLLPTHTYFKCEQ
ncbi:MAG: hypothetical protein J5895_04085 [Alphaproteobacteria bacterium]|nr:hypothetical protein [Alphaproteobacteria bacterium]